MRRLLVSLTAVTLAAALAAPAQAENWVWFEISGGAVGFDLDSRKIDIAGGTVAANTLTYYEKERPVADKTFRFVAERLEFDCRENRHRWSQSAVLDSSGGVVVAREDGDWVPLPEEMGSTALYRRMLCEAETPPTVKSAETFDALVTAMRGSAPLTTAGPPATSQAPAPPASGAPILEAYAESLRPKIAEAPAVRPSSVLPAAPALSPPSPPPPEPEPAPVAAAPAPTPAPAPAPSPVRPAEIAASPAPPRPAEIAPAPAATRTAPAPARNYRLAAPQAADNRCVTFKEQENLTWVAINACSYPVTYAWCVTGGTNPAGECADGAVLPGGGRLSARGVTLTSYPGGVGRRHVFVCRTPAIPIVRETGGRFEHQCGTETAEAPRPAAAATRAPEPDRSPPRLRR